MMLHYNSSIIVHALHSCLLYTGNGLATLPAGVGALANLRTIRLSNNFLTSLPRELGSLRLLQEVYIDGNRDLEQAGLRYLMRQRPGIRIVGNEEHGVS